MVQDQENENELHVPFQLVVKQVLENKKNQFMQTIRRNNINNLTISLVI